MKADIHIMIKRITSWFLTCALLMSFSVLGKAQAKPITDSLFSIVRNGQMFFVHRIKPGQTLYQIATSYNMTMQQLRTANALTTDELRLGKLFFIPTSLRNISRNVKFSGGKIPIYYKVGQSETAYSIAKLRFNMSVDTLSKLNKLTNFAISQGQLLLVGWHNKQVDTAVVMPKVQVMAAFTPTGEVNNELKTAYSEQMAAGKKESTMEGAAIWRKDFRLSGAKALFALCNYAKAGSVVKIYNPRFSRTVYVKILGPLPPLPQTDNAVIFITPTVAKALGGVDYKFFVRVKYVPE